ncbi:MAG: 16S rRNA (guanine(527)-N(7))-methyltransferase RsmG [Tissierellia bacterium]|nr:16S rRNA (guanine(527)-N(7))-methyltransferase RsmG [Tissierellia bacterium]
MLRELLLRSDIQVSEEQLEQLHRFKELVLEWNEKFNITAITDPQEFDLKHLYDCILILKAGVFQPNSRIIDIGTGGGFPGIPLKILLPEAEIVLVDSLNKRIGFLEHVIETLDLKLVRAQHARAEEMSRTASDREKYDLCVSRAVAPMNTLAEYCLPFVKPGGYFVSMKGSSGQEELKVGKNAIETLGGKVKKSIPYTLLPNDHQRYIFIIEKVSSTPAKYPRGGGKPKNKPL